MLYRVYIGTEFDKNNQPLAKEVVATVLFLVETDLARTFGGYTSTKSSGGYIHANGALAKECSFVYEVVTNDSERDSAPLVRAIANRAGEYLNQESVLVVAIEARHEFI